MKSRARFLFGFLLTLATPAAAHVGSPDVFFEGNAGPYHLFVTVRTPQVIPGIAGIEIRSQSNEVRELRIVPLRLTGPGSQFAPTPDVAERSKDDPQFFTGSLWLMEFGALQVRIEAEGTRGKGQLAVPVLAEAQRTLPMQKSLGVLLLFLMLLLAAGVISIAGAGVREAKLEPGVKPGPESGRRARMAMAGASLVVVGVIYLGNRWWNSEARNYQGFINFAKPPKALATLQPGGRLVLRAQGQDPNWSKWVKPEKFIPDHGHLMHLFLIRLPGMEHLMHLHPDRIEKGDFAEDLPSMPAGRYQIFADVVDDGGFPWTLVGEIDLPDIAGRPLAGDDSEASAVPISDGALDSRVAALPDGGRMVWERDAALLKANVPTYFRFRMEDQNGKPAQGLEPYMGMAGHAEFVRSDRTVFAHVHPAGSVSMAALQLAEASLMPNSPQPQASPHAGMAMSASTLPPEVSFPYGFPQPGLYRIFVQVKRAGRIETGVFDARVQ